MAPGEELTNALLRALGVDPATVEATAPLPAGYSGATLLRLRLPGSHSRILKLIRPQQGWLGATSQDTRMREVALAASGLLRELPGALDTGALATARVTTGDGAAYGALLLRDAQADLARYAQGGERFERLLDRLALLHARFWEDSRLRDPALGLMQPGAALQLLSPASLAASIAAGDNAPYLPLASAGWEAFFRLTPSETAAQLRAIFADPDPLLATLATLPSTLLHGDVWGPNLGWTARPARRLLLLDWGLAAVGPAPYDPLWLCGSTPALSPTRTLALYAARLRRRLAARGIALAPAVWQALVDAAYLRTTLTCGEAFGRAAAEAALGRARNLAEARVRWWAARARRAAQRLR